MVKRKKADIDIFLNELSTKILNNEHGLIKETIDEKTGICTKVEVSGVLEVYPDKIEYKGVAVTAKEDMDFATILVGQNIALMSIFLIVGTAILSSQKMLKKMILRK